MLGTNELLLIIAAGLILFGGKKIPEFARGVGSALKEFKMAAREEKEVKKIVEDSLNEGK